jgi:hypothetical protein
VDIADQGSLHALMPSRIADHRRGSRVLRLAKVREINKVLTFANHFCPRLKSVMARWRL